MASACARTETRASRGDACWAFSSTERNASYKSSRDEPESRGHTATLNSFTFGCALVSVDGDRHDKTNRGPGQHTSWKEVLGGRFVGSNEAVAEQAREREPHAGAAVQAIARLEHFALEGVQYEAFNTSGGLGSLADTYGARVQVMDYKTIRYPGHCAQMRLLMNDLKLNHDRATLKRVLENAVPQTLQDVVIVYVAVAGRQDGELREENYVSKIYPQMIAGRLWSAIQVTTAAGITAVVDLVLREPGRYRGFVRQEDFSLTDVLANRFGRHYADGGNKDVSGRVIVAGRTGHQRLAREMH